MLVCGLAGLASARDAPAVGRDLVVALQLEPPTLDPTTGAAAAIDDVTYHTIFEGLTRLDRAGVAHPLLALGWTSTPDHREYVFRLCPGVRFQDGTRFDAETAAFALRRAIRPGSANAQAQALSSIAGIDVRGPLTLHIRLSRPDATLPRTLALPDLAMVAPGSAARLAQAPVGTGPFHLAEWRRGDRIRLARNAAYWGTAPALPGLEFRFIADPAAAASAIRTHAVDLIPAFPAPELLTALARDPALRVSTGPSQAEVILALNNADGPLRDLRVRRAIAYALDRPAIIAGAMYGRARAIGSHFPPQDPDYVDLTGRYPHDPARARALLAAAGYRQGFPLTLILPPPSYARRAGEIVAAQLGAVGIRVAIVPIDWAPWLDRVFARHAFQATIVAHVEPFDYEIYGRREYYFGYDGRVVAALIAQVRAAADPGERRALLAAIQRRIAEDAVNGFLFQYPRLSVADARLRGLWADTPVQAVDYAAARFAGVSGGRDRRSGPQEAARGAALLAAIGLAALIVAAIRRLGVRWLIGRGIVLAATLFAASILIFVLLDLVPGDPAQVMLGLEARPEAVAALRAELGLQGSAIARYLRWAGGLLRGDAGTSYAYRVPVAGLIAPRLAVSLPLAAMAEGFAILVGLGAALAAAGLSMAAAPWRGIDRLVSAAAALGAAIPNFWLALLLLAIGTAIGHGAGGFPGWGDGMGAGLTALVAPALALGVPQAAILCRVARAAIAEESGRDYVRTARAKHLPRRAILLVHILPNATPAMLAVIGLQLPFLVAGGVLVETVFSLPGLGRLAVQAVAGRDLVTLQAVVLLLVVLTMLSSVVIDIAHGLADPRLRLR